MGIMQGVSTEIFFYLKTIFLLHVNKYSFGANEAGTQMKSNGWLKFVEWMIVRRQAVDW